MESMPLLIVLFASIPEEFLITVLGLKLFGIRIRPLIGKIVVIAILQAVAHCISPLFLNEISYCDT